MDIKNALELANKEFVTANIDNYFFETRELMAVTLGKTKEWLMSNINYELSNFEYEKFVRLKERRIEGEPLQYILGEQYFMGLRFLVNNNVLIPRADTEILVYKVLEVLNNKSGTKILDMCTGSGCIAISLAKSMNDIKVCASDISAHAIMLARENAKINDVDVEFYTSNLFEKIPEQKFDIIVSNPPYISENEMKELAKDVLMEPKLALDGGEDGLKFYREISKEAIKYLSDDGILVFEIGYNQAKAVTNILKELSYKDIELIKDYSNNDRVLIAKR